VLPPLTPPRLFEEFEAGRMTRAQLQLVSFCSSDKADDFTRFLQQRSGDW